MMAADLAYASDLVNAAAAAPGIAPNVAARIVKLIEADIISHLRARSICAAPPAVSVAIDRAIAAIEAGMYRPSRHSQKDASHHGK